MTVTEWEIIRTSLGEWNLVRLANVAGSYTTSSDATTFDRRPASRSASTSVTLHVG